MLQSPSPSDLPHLPTGLLCAALLIASVVPMPGLAQQAPVTATFWHLADTGVVRTVGTAVFERLGGALSQAALDPDPRPWTINIPDDAAEPWQMLRAHLYRALNARPREASDTIGGVLSIESVRVHGDSLTASFTVGVTWRCRDGGGGGGYTGYEMRAWRYGSHWQPPRSEAVLFGDSMPCPQP